MPGEDSELELRPLYEPDEFPPAGSAA